MPNSKVPISDIVVDKLHAARWEKEGVLFVRERQDGFFKSKESKFPLIFLSIYFTSVLVKTAATHFFEQN